MAAEFDRLRRLQEFTRPEMFTRDRPTRQRPAFGLGGAPKRARGSLTEEGDAAADGSVATYPSWMKRKAGAPMSGTEKGLVAGVAILGALALALIIAFVIVPAADKSTKASSGGKTGSGSATKTTGGSAAKVGGGLAALGGVTSAPGASHASSLSPQQRQALSSMPAGVRPGAAYQSAVAADSLSRQQAYERSRQGLLPSPMGVARHGAYAAAMPSQEGMLAAVVDSNPVSAAVGARPGAPPTMSQYAKPSSANAAPTVLGPDLFAPSSDLARYSPEEHAKQEASFRSGMPRLWHADDNTRKAQKKAELARAMATTGRVDLTPEEVLAGASQFTCTRNMIMSAINAQSDFDRSMIIQTPWRFMYQPDLARPVVPAPVMSNLLNDSITPGQEAYIMSISCSPGCGGYVESY